MGTAPTCLPGGGRGAGNAALLAGGALPAAVGTARGAGAAAAAAAGVFFGGGSAAGGGTLMPSSSATGGSLPAPLGAAMALDTWIMKPHLRHFMRTDRPATFSSAIWYFALQLGQRNFIQRSAVARWALVFRDAKDSEEPHQERAGTELSPGSKRRASKKRAECICARRPRPGSQKTEQMLADRLLRLLVRG